MSYLSLTFIFFLTLAQFLFDKQTPSYFLQTYNNIHVYSRNKKAQTTYYLSSAPFYCENRFGESLLTN